MNKISIRQNHTGVDTSTPAKALEALEAGNERFIKGEIMAPNRNMERLKELQGGQAPFAAFLACADSRVPVEVSTQKLKFVKIPANPCSHCFLLVKSPFTKR